MNDSEQFMLRWKGREFGPFSVTELNRQLDEHEIGMSHEIHFEEKWVTIEEFLAASRPQSPTPPPGNKPAVHQPTLPRLAGHSRIEIPPASPGTTLPGQPNPLLRSPGQLLAAPALPSAEASTLTPGRPRSRLIFAFLAVLLGFSGAHNYYAGQWLTGLLQLLLSVATFLLGFGIIASWVWALIEAVVVRRDARGEQMI